MTEKGEELKAQIKSLVGEYYQEVFANKQFSPGVNNVPVSGKVFDHVELQYLVESSLDGWFTTGRFNVQFERELAQFIQVRLLCQPRRFRNAHC
jgi:CDP-6-deoxy-D-xylo-4-hexulose-3-dehydrase